MKATIISPVLSDTKPIAICVVIPFDTVEVSIALSGGVTTQKEGGKWLHKNDVRIYEKNTDKDLTLEILGSENNHTYDGNDLTLILNKVSDYEKNKESKLSPEIQKQINELKNLKSTILEKTDNKFAYLKFSKSNSFNVYEITNNELQKQITDLVLSFCSTKIEKLQKNNL